MTQPEISIDDLANRLTDQFSDDEKFMHFMMGNIDDMAAMFRENNLNVINGIPGQPAVIIGFVPGQDAPTIEYNLYGILEDLIAIHGNALFNSDSFDTLFDAYMSQLQAQAQATMENRDSNDGWGNERVRNENAHDNSVNIAYKRSWNNIQRENKKSKKEYYLANIRSYYFEWNQRVNAELMQFSIAKDECKKLLEYCKKNPIPEPFEDDKKNIIRAKEFIGRSDELIKYHEIINTGIKRLPKLQQELINLQNILKILQYMEKNNEFMSSVGCKEIDVLLSVWKRIHSNVNKNNTENLLGLLTSELLTLVAPNRPNGIECINGRVGAIISALEVYDHDNLVEIKSVPALRVQIVQNKAPVIVDEFFSKSDPKLVNDYINNVNNPLVDVMLTNLCSHIKVTIESEFKDMLAPFHLKKFIDEVCSEFIQ